MRRIMGGIALIGLLASGLAVQPVAADTFSLTGTVTDAADSAPIASAVVVALGTDGVAHPTVTDADGAYALDLDAGTYSVRVQAPNHALDVTDVELADAAAHDVALTRTGLTTAAA
jgi:carboxypeptidase family protein